MKRFAEFSCVLLSLTSFSANAAQSAIELKTGQELCTIFKTMKATLKGPEVERKIHVKVGKEEALTGNLSLTSKGNGTLRIANLLLRTFDEHDDGTVYKDSCLSVRFKDPNKEGYPIFEVSGIALMTDDKSDKPLAEQKVELQYKYVPKERRFLKITQPYFDFIELKTGKSH
jgi:hypothetical protein